MGKTLFFALGETFVAAVLYSKPFFANSKPNAMVVSPYKVIHLLIKILVFFRSKIKTMCVICKLLRKSIWKFNHIWIVNYFFCCCMHWFSKLANKTFAYSTGLVGLKMCIRVIVIWSLCVKVNLSRSENGNSNFQMAFVGKLTAFTLIKAILFLDSSKSTQSLKSH